MYGMKVGDYVKQAHSGNVGCVTETGNGSVYVTNATTDKRAFWTAISLVASTKEEYDAQVEQRLHPPAQISVETTPPQKTYHWLCFECGNTYNGRECPQCGGTDRIENVNTPHVSQPSRTEMYAPEEGD